MREPNVKWLIEYKASRPYPVFVTGKMFACIDPSNALQFKTREDAQLWAVEYGYGSPWHAVQHSFAE